MSPIERTQGFSAVDDKGNPIVGQEAEREEIKPTKELDPLVHMYRAIRAGLGTAAAEMHLTMLHGTLPEHTTDEQTTNQEVQTQQEPRRVEPTITGGTPVMSTSGGENEAVSEPTSTPGQPGSGLPSGPGEEWH